MYYIIQNNLFREEGHEKLINCLDKFKIDYEVVNVLPNSEEIGFKTKRKDVFVFGSLKLARLSKKYNWNPGALITENHNYEVYSQHYKDNLLNYDSRIVNYGDDFEWFSNKHFIRPCLDSKVFTGKVFSKEDWNIFKQNALNSKTSLTNETKLQISIPKNITQEVRCWVVDGKIVTQSTYRRGTLLVYDEIVDIDAIEFARNMVDIFQLSKTFTIDVCLTDNNWKIVECGSTACAGFYSADMQKIIMSLEDTYNPKKWFNGIDGDIYKSW